MMSNNPLSIERGGLASSQGDYILRRSQCVLSWVVMVLLQGQTVGCGSLSAMPELTATHHHHRRRREGSNLMGRTKYTELSAHSQKQSIHAVITVNVFISEA